MSASKPIYLDHQATTPCDPRVVEAMLPFFGERFGNPSSRTHAFGWEADEAVEGARRRVARALSARADQIVFTSGATESLNIAIRGTAARAKPGVIYSQRTEHKAVLDALEAAEKSGHRVRWLPLDAGGRVEGERLAEVTAEDLRLVVVMAANNETGTLQPLLELGSWARDNGALFVVDGAQMVGKLPLSVRDLPIDLLAISGHKVYGPKGIGALFVGERARQHGLEPLIPGGGQERGLRGGTLNVPGIAGLARALELSVAEMADEGARLSDLRDRLEAELDAALDGVHRNGHREQRLPHTTNLSFEGVPADALLLSLPELAVSAGSACTSDRIEASHVLLALGVPDALARASLRIGLGRFTTEEEVERCVALIVERVKQLRRR